ncbi:transglutaminase-like cysteine peptidase [Prosthecodimorpha staleyi]|uniref:Transglutaminase-like cysteine peptidase n=1 Tax=Prosthecodimorpha staleyi TaxID=2840188 RepID=A0A947D6I1_9HYPH|nr:transglutaminase-like cysteine peptidase [Prosthecodimorpha staleyi]MBT9291973.1 transglutaminase-like cysteine peptidase [Prosthecodimorpha staleyi]
MRNVKFFIAAAAAIWVMSGTGQAFNLSGTATHFKKARSGLIREGGWSVSPMGHVMFCQTQPAECRKPSLVRAMHVSMTGARFAALETINRAVNRAIIPLNDRTGPGVIDQWSLAPKSGDCEDFAITKRHRLVAAGWPASALRLAIGRLPDGEGHAVLIVRTDKGDFVLDNRTDDIRPWRGTDIRWVSMQSGTNPQFWRSI